MTPTQPFDSVRMLAWDLLQSIEKSSVFADAALDQAFLATPSLRPLDRAFLLEMVMGTLRWRGRLDAILSRSLTAKGKKLDLRLVQLLRLGAYQILFMDRVPDAAAVNESVLLARQVFKNDRIAGFVNALLRTLSRTKGEETFPPFPREAVEHICQALSHPRWLVERWVEEFGPETARRICQENNRKPPFTLRANTLKTTREDLLKKLEALDLSPEAAPFSPEGLILRKGAQVAEESLFQQGMYFVQDEASQVVAHLLGPLPGERILDACSAPGGKSTHLAQLMGDRGEILATDLRLPKVRRVEENCRRLGIRAVRALPADAVRPLPFAAGSTFDRILVDAPCSALGILHRNPEAKWRRKPEDLPALSRLQGAILANVSSWLKPGGVLLYSTCTLAREENDGVVQAFLARHPGFVLEDLRGTVPDFLRPLIDSRGFYRTYPEQTTSGENRMDGFFAARMRKG